MSRHLSPLPRVLLRALLCLLLVPSSRVLAGSSSPDWPQIIDRAVPAVVQLRVNATRDFYMEDASTPVATGFVVDAERGLVLTNRHVVTAGPVRAKAIFVNNEEVAVEAVYRDPVHDFGLFRFDPSELRFQELTALELDAEAAEVGMEVRIIGNDAGEKISILSGTLARLDRAAPSYGRGRYNDFNTFYIQAASGTSGGSSGSPVIDGRGRVVALNAGARRTSAQSYFLPLDRVVRALDLIQRGEPVTRGTVQAVFLDTSYDELRRLGLQAETEVRLRAEAPDSSGLLVVREVVPGGPAHGILKPGDVLLSLDGSGVRSFSQLEATFDRRVGDSLELGLLRGGEALSVAVQVGDLHAISPNSYLEFGQGIFHELGYHQARGHALPVSGVVVASGGYAFGTAGIGEDALIRAVAGEETPDLDTFEAVLARQPDGARVPVRFVRLSDHGHELVRVVDIDRRWFPMRRCTLDLESLSWPCTPSAAPPPVPATEAGTGPVPEGGGRIGDRLGASMVLVDFDIPLHVQGVYGAHYQGTGLVVDVERGWVIVDRDTVPIALGDVTLTFGGSLEVPGEVAWLHPVHNLALVSYDPAAIGETPVRAARFGARLPDVGDRIFMVGLNRRSEVVSRRTRVGSTSALVLPLPSPPSFRPMNVDTLRPEDASASSGGVLAHRNGEVLALWASYVDLSGDPSGHFAGLPAGVITDMLDHLRGEGGDWPDLGIEWREVTIAQARQFGLSDARAALAETSLGRRLFMAYRIDPVSPAGGLVRPGDLLLSLDGEPVSDFRALEAAARSGGGTLKLLRDGHELDVEVGATSLSGSGISRMMSWAGLILHAPHRDLSLQRGTPLEGVYIAWFWYGSPAARHKLRATRRIVEVDGQPTPDLDAFAEVVRGMEDGASVRLQTIDLDGRELSLTLELDLASWPTEEVRRGESGWERVPIAP